MVPIFRDCGHRAALVEPRMQGQWIHLFLLIFVLLTHSCITVAVGKYSLCRCKLMSRRKRIHNSVCNQQGFLIRMYKWLRDVKCRTCIPVQVFILNIIFGCNLVTSRTLGKLNASKFISISSEKMCACVHVCSFLSGPKWMLLVHHTVFIPRLSPFPRHQYGASSFSRTVADRRGCSDTHTQTPAHWATHQTSTALPHCTGVSHADSMCPLSSPLFTLPRLFASCCGRFRARAQISCGWPC